LLWVIGDHCTGLLVGSTHGWTQHESIS
jgi:hypothetical protein